MTKPLLKLPAIIPTLATHPILAASTQRAQAREEAIARLALLVGDRGEAQRAVELAERVGFDASTVYNLAARGEPLPKTAEELLATAEAGWRRVEDLARILGLG
ncbi:hypothetical protein WMF30_10590 [Sorangium sp. So ce134]